MKMVGKVLKAMMLCVLMVGGLYQILWGDAPEGRFMVTVALLVAIYNRLVEEEA